ncbi:unnamed protein product [Caenorhabditis sp. 36 PRJEB53466]|nr:unnamed protein product [Caenorhabditis sp. 36 PRJEB53466]
MLSSLLLFAVLGAPAESSSCNVLYQLDDMSYCRIGQPFDAYRYYGCSCSGVCPDKPLDGIDKCCQVHIDCYTDVTNSGKCQNSNAPFFCLYKWQCMDQEPACSNENKCRQSVCECDEQFIDCLAKYPYPTYARKCPYYQGDPLLKHLTTLAPPTD